jgi:hypothetical protein
MITLAGITVRSKNFQEIKNGYIQTVFWQTVIGQRQPPSRHL